MNSSGQNGTLRAGLWGEALGWGRFLFCYPLLTPAGLAALAVLRGAGFLPSSKMVWENLEAVGVTPPLVPGREQDSSIT